MNRRGMFKSLFGGAAIASVVIGAPVETKNIEVDGWEIRWTGWKESQSSTCINGQWLAAKSGVTTLSKEWRIHPLIYSAVPGMMNIYSPGGMFNQSLDNKYYKEILTTLSSDKEKEEYKKIGFDRIKNFIENSISIIDWSRQIKSPLQTIDDRDYVHPHDLIYKSFAYDMSFEEALEYLKKNASI